MPKVGHVVCPLGVGEHLEYWGFSGRLLKRNQAPWASFVVESPTLKVFIGGDSGYGPHFKAIVFQTTTSERVEAAL